MATHTDEELLRLIARGDDEAAGALVNRYWHAVVHEAQATGIDREDAKQVANDVFGTILDLAKKQRLRVPIWAFVRRTSRNRAIDRHRHEEAIRKHAPAIADELGQPRGDARTKLVSHRRTTVRRALRALPARDREILGWVSHGVSDKELAEYLEVTEINARQLRHRALRKLRDSIEKHAGTKPIESSSE